MANTIGNAFELLSDFTAIKGSDDQPISDKTEERITLLEKKMEGLLEENMYLRL